jgi:hypothetical protein
MKCTTDFWIFGHRLFRTKPETFPVPFIQGSVLDAAIIAEYPVQSTGSAPAKPRPRDLRSLTSLNELQGHVSAFFAGLFFHLFSHDDQARLARSLAGLLAPEAGAMILGLQVGTGKREEFPMTPGYTLVSHSTESWKEMWEEAFDGCDIEVRVNVRAHSGGPTTFGLVPGRTAEVYILEWAVTRL